MKSIAKFLLGVYIFEVGLFFLLCLIAVIKGIAVSWSGHTLFECLVYSIGPTLIPMFFLVIHFVFCAFFPNVLRFLATVVIMPWILVFTALVTIPASGFIPPKSFSQLSEVERVDVLKSEVQVIWERAKADPNGKDAEWVKNWEMWNHNPDGSNRKYESQFAEYDGQKASIIQKRQQEEQSKSTRLKILHWFFPG